MISSTISSRISFLSSRISCRICFIKRIITASTNKQKEANLKRLYHSTFYLTRRNRLIFEILFGDQRGRHRHREFHIVHQIRWRIVSHRLFDDFFRDPSIWSRNSSDRRGIGQCFYDFIVRQFRTENVNPWILWINLYVLEKWFLQAALAFAPARALTLSSRVVWETLNAKSSAPASAIPLSCNIIPRGKRQYAPLRELEWERKKEKDFHSQTVWVRMGVIAEMNPLV